MNRRWLTLVLARALIRVGNIWEFRKLNMMHKTIQGYMMDYGPGLVKVPTSGRCSLIREAKTYFKCL